MLSSLRHKVIAVFSLTVITVLVAAGCASSNGNASSGKAGAQEGKASFQISSSSFTEIRPKKRIPQENTCYGKNLSPPLTWSGAPPRTDSFALLVEDVDHRYVSWTHWVIYNIPGEANELTAGIPTTTRVLPDGTTQGTNDYSLFGYNGPCQPPVSKRGKLLRGARPEPAHRYVFTLYALDITLDVAPGAPRSKLLDAMDGHILAQVETTGKSQGIIRYGAGVESHE